MAVPTYPVGGTVQARALQANNASADQFGGQTAQALGNIGQAVAFTGQRMAAIEREEKAKADSARVMDAYTQAKGRLREALYRPVGEAGTNDPGGLYNRTLGNASGIEADADKLSREIFQGAIEGLEDDDQKTAFDQMWQRTHEATLDGASRFEFDQMQEYREQAKAAALASLQDDAIANFNNPAALSADLDAARAMIRSNPEGLPTEALSRAEREAVSKIHMSVIQRMSQENPGDALDYYESIQSQINGTDHATAQTIIGGVAEARQARSAVQELAGNAAANDVVQTVSSGAEPAPIRLPPEQAVDIARGLGIAVFEGMTPAEAQSFLDSEAGAAVSARITTAALGQNLGAFNNDLEAALVAMVAGPDVATDWLNAGRDYGALPNAEEGFKAVREFVERYTGSGVVAEGSAGVQAALNGETAGIYVGDPVAFLSERLSPAAGADAALNMDVETAGRLAGLIDNAPEIVQAGLQVITGEGQAATIGWMGGSFSEAPPEVQRWVFDNAQRFGLNFPEGIAPWKIEAVEANGGGQEGQDLIEGSFAALGLPVSLAPQTGSAADYYTRGKQPFTVQATAGDLNTQLRLAQERYADNPSLLAEVQRQIKNDHATRSGELEQQQTQLMQQGFAQVLQGQTVNSMDPQMLLALGTENVGKLLTLEGKFNGGDSDKTDDATYYSLTMMDPAEFAQLNLLDYADQLSGSDLRKMADEQAKLQRPDTSSSAITGMRTRTQIVADTVNMMGWEPNKRTQDAATVSQFERVLDERIAQWGSENPGKSPGAVEIQKMVDGLLIEGKTRGTGDAGFFGNHFFGIGADTGRSARAFELTPAERNEFTVAETFPDIPVEAHDVVANGYRLMFGEDPNEDGALQFYNDMSVVMIGGQPSPPDGLYNVIAQALAGQLQRRPSDGEIAAFYTRMIERSAGLR